MLWSLILKNIKCPQIRGLPIRITFQDQLLWSLSGSKFYFSGVWIWYQNRNRYFFRCGITWTSFTGFKSHHGKCFDRIESQRTARNSHLLNSLLKSVLKSDFSSSSQVFGSTSAHTWFLSRDKWEVKLFILNSGSQRNDKWHRKLHLPFRQIALCTSRRIFIWFSCGHQESWV